jgi:hypothetical protein
MILAKYVGTSGGEIIHTEIRSDHIQNSQPASKQNDDKE